MKYLLIVLFLVSCAPSKMEIETTQGTFNKYELIQVGPFNCVGSTSNGKPGGVWCEREKSVY